ncbi:unnamed protein product [Adineta ricciae]|uniref:NmrA-like domain-containing protein n=1 Tax=Adineta ricciae TaxID=249248 RepID=A0A815QGA5_ADIRI|nr:unnamed protein product [Adineta ricciae]
MTRDTYRNVLLVGGAGDLGKHILFGLLEDSSFNVTVLSRLNSNSLFPSNVKVLKVDYSNKNSIIESLTGQDVVISAVGGEGLSENIDMILVECALQADVKWFIPSQFVSDISHPFYSSLPFTTPKIETMELLKKNESKMAYTFITTGTFLDWGLDNGFLGFDIPNRTVTLYDHGENFFSATTLSSVVKAVVAILHHPQLAQNKRIYIADATMTQNEILQLFEKYTNTKWTIKHMSTDDSFKQGAENYANGDRRKGIHQYLMSVIYNGKGASRFDDKLSNKALGLPSIQPEEIIKEVVQRCKTL